MGSLQRGDANGKPGAPARPTEEGSRPGSKPGALQRPGSMRTTTGVLPVLLPARNSSAVHTFTDALGPSLPHANVRVVHSDTLLVWPRLSWATRLNGLDKSRTDSSQLDSKIVLFLLAFVMLICTLAVMWRCIVGLLDW